MRFAPLRGVEELDEPDAVPSLEPDDSRPGAKNRRRDAHLAAAARRLGIDPSFDLKARGEARDARHQDDELQTLVLPEELERILRSIHQKARTSIQETGANVLHMMFGFVEWTDVPGAQAVATDYRAAPLVLVPVGIERKHMDHHTRTYLYEVRATGEDWDTNVTLQEKCRVDIGAELPGISDDEKLEDYFRRVENWLAQNTRGWRLKRFVTLGMASFGKILMWRDLDPANWPTRQPLLDTPLLREMLGADALEGGSAQGESVRITDEYAIDALAQSERPPPTILDADTSQHSVLVDVARGKSLVVQGPPGTGKSQTIANLIAAEISRGKRVLFVAEKKAALDVVYRRLAVHSKEVVHAASCSRVMGGAPPIPPWGRRSLYRRNQGVSATRRRAELVYGRA